MDPTTTVSILKKFPRPYEPPPYPGRSVIINYDIDDPLHWKNQLEKKLDFADCVKRSDADVRPVGSGPSSTLSNPIRSSPVATGAALTLAELKRKQLSKRQARLNSPGNSPTQEGSRADQEDIDSAEISLEERLKRLLEKEENEISVDSQPNSPLPEARPPHPKRRLSDGGQVNSPSPNDHNSFLHAPQAAQSDQQQSAMRVNPQFHVYGSSSAPTLRQRSTSTRAIFSSATNQKSADISLHNPPNKSTHPPNHLVSAGNYPSPTPPLSLENSPSASFKSKRSSPEQAILRAHSSLRAEMYSVSQKDGGQLGLDVSFSEDEVDSVDEQRPPSSDEGFGGKHFESDSSTEDLARKQVLMMYDMQMKLLRKLKKDKHKSKMPKEMVNPKYLPLRKRCDSVPESEMRQRCEFLENHIATLARNIDHLTEEVQNQQAFIEAMHRSRQPVSQNRRPQTIPVRSSSQRDLTSPKSHGQVPSSPQAAMCVVEPVVISNPDRVIKLTKFFGDEPPLVRIFLKKLGYEKYAPIFEREKIGSNELPYMTDDRLRRLGIPMGPRTRILQEARFILKSTESPSSDKLVHDNYNLV